MWPAAVSKRGGGMGPQFNPREKGGVVSSGVGSHASSTVSCRDSLGAGRLAGGGWMQERKALQQSSAVGGFKAG